MNKEQSADDPRGSDSCKICLIAPFLYELLDPDVVITCIEHKVSLKHSKQLSQRWWLTIII